jgi:iron complex outermembrane recepter protein
MLKKLMPGSPLSAALGAMLLAATAFAQSPQRIEVPAGDLVAALESLAKQTNVNLVYPAAEMQGIKTPGVSGNLTPREAVVKLLEGTPLQLQTDEVTGAMLISEQAPTDHTKPHASNSHSTASTLHLAQANTPATPDTGTAETSAAGGQGAGTGLEEIVVTATRRAESIEKVPISIYALSQNDLTQEGVKGIADIAALTPGLQYQTFGTITTISIRGINTATGGSVVGVYLDDTPVQGRLSGPGNVGNFYPAVFDLNRVEVARGPQGTLFGAGSEAGTIRFIPNEPSLTQLSGDAHAEWSTTQGGAPSYEIGMAVGGPMVKDEVGFRVSAWTRYDGGYVDFLDPVTGDIVDHNVNDHRTSAFRAALTFRMDDIRITPTVFYQTSHSGDSDYFYGSPIANPSAGQFIDAGFFPQVWNDNFVLPTLKVEATLPFAELTSTTSYMHRYLTGASDASFPFSAAVGGYGSPLGPEFPTSESDAAPFDVGQKARAITEEVRLTSNRPGAFFTWVAGVFYDHRAQEDWQTSSSLAIDPTGALILNTDQNVIDEQTAVYAQGDIHLSHQLTATLGERVAKVESDYNFYVGPGVFDVGLPPYSHTSLNETPSTPRVALSYQADSNNLFYISASKGFRVGGGNANVPSVCDYTAPGSYKSDYLWNYEVGAKSSLFGARLQVDSSIYHIAWSQIQQLITLPCGIPIQFTANSGSAASNGFDLDVQALVTQKLRVGVAVAYTNAYFTSGVRDQLGNPLVLAGDKIGSLPQVNAPWNLNLNAAYNVPLSQNETLYLRGEYLYDSRNPGPFNSNIPGSPQYTPLDVPNPPTHLTNMRVGYTRGKWEVSAFLNNVFNSHPLLTAGVVPGSTLYSYNTFRPRTVGLTANVDF